MQQGCSDNSLGRKAYRLETGYAFYLETILFVYIFVKNKPMCAIEYGSILLYVQSRTSLLAKIQAIDAIEDKILEAMLDQASGAGVGIAMYELDDGQVRIKTNYRSSQEITEALNALNLVKQRYIRQLQGSTILLRSASTINRGGGYCC